MEERIDSTPWLLEETRQKPFCTKKCGVITLFGVVLLGVFATIAVCLALVLRKERSFEFVSFNDIHIDPLYEPYSDVVRDPEFWCRRPFNGTTKAFKFGQYGCDPPNITFLSALEHMKSVVEEPMFVLFGGDAAGHDLGLNRDELRDLINWTISKTKEALPGVPILITLGNNDFEKDYGEASTDALDFESVGRVMREFMNDEQHATFLKGGYYFHDIPDVKIRLLLLNTVLYSSKRSEAGEDPQGQFEWIRNVSQDAIAKGLSVGAAMHISPGVTHWSMSQGWHDKYVQKFDRLAKEMNIKFTIVGHNHNDMLLPLYGDSGASLGYSLSSPAISPVHSNNPGFRITKMKDGEISDIVQYYADIMMNPDELVWQREYSFTKAYNVEDVSRESVLKAVEWISSSGEGMWSYREKLGARASDHGSFYYCILRATTTEQVKECMKGLNSLKSLSPYNDN